MTEVSGQRSEVSKSIALSFMLFALCFFSAVLLALCSFAEAQQPKKIPRIGVLVPGSPPTRPGLEKFRQGLRELGYAEGQNILLELRWDEGNPKRWSELARELVRFNVDILVAGTGSATVAAKDATSGIPIVMAAVPDPVERGLVQSLARPGGLITGLSVMTPDIDGKRLELLKETVPSASRVAVLWDGNSTEERQLRHFKAIAQPLHIQLDPLGVRGANDLDGAFQSAVRARARAIITAQSPLFVTYRTKIAELALKHRFPTVSGEIGFAEAGGLMTYGPNIADSWWRAAKYVDKILRGAKPADLPVEQPTKFELVINLKTAKQIGLTIPPNVLARADKVIR
jgi:putative tryptophan/tyrosine transport system substrate-binding protein